jgi:hypothetical protein
MEILPTPPPTSQTVVPRGSLLHGKSVATSRRRAIVIWTEAHHRSQHLLRLRLPILSFQRRSGMLASLVRERTEWNELYLQKQGARVSYPGKVIKSGSINFKILAKSHIRRWCWRSQFRVVQYVTEARWCLETFVCTTSEPLELKSIVSCNAGALTYGDQN